MLGIIQISEELNIVLLHSKINMSLKHRILAS